MAQRTDESLGTAMTRRQLLRMIGLSAGGAAMYRAMSRLGLAAESPYAGPPRLGAAPRGSSVLVLGAGIAGMVAACELRKAGYRAQVLECTAGGGGRNWTVRRGDRYTKLGGHSGVSVWSGALHQGPWRLPYHHQGILSYCKLLGVPLEAFVQVNNNAWLHNRKAFGGKPQRFRAVKADHQGHVAELLGNATQGGKLDGQVTRADQEKLLASLRDWGALDKNHAYVKGERSNSRLD